MSFGEGTARAGRAGGFGDEGADGSGSAAGSALSVSEAMALAKGALEGVTVRLVGEVSEVSNKPGYKAVYFTVKDEGAALSCLMWNNRFRSCGVQLTVGMRVELTGRFTLYAAKGRMNFDVFSLVMAGEGNLRLQVANLARKLQAEGLMDAARKRPLPAFPETIGLVTSPSGAAVHDVLRTLRRRYPLARVLLAGVLVEGQSAPAGIVEGIERVCATGAEVVLVVRGGGSFENLMPFNDEGLARAIAACPVPVVTGIGHETDTLIADMVADMRASTPTGAAQAVAPDVADVRAALDARASAMGSCLSHRIERSQERLRALAARPLFADESYLLAAESQAVDLLAERLPRALPASLERSGFRLDALAGRLASALPRSLERDWARVAAAGDRLRQAPLRALERDAARVAASNERLRRALPLATQRESAALRALSGRLARAGQAQVPRFQAQVGMAAARLHDLSPLAVLGRGYAIARAEGAVVKSVAQAPPGTLLNVSVSDGELACTVQEACRVDTSVEVLEESE